MPVTLRLVWGKFDVIRDGDRIGSARMETIDTGDGPRSLYRCYDTTGRWLGDRRTEAGALGLVNSQDKN